jgi:hypothetical protein
MIHRTPALSRPSYRIIIAAALILAGVWLLPNGASHSWSAWAMLFLSLGLLGSALLLKSLLVKHGHARPSRLSRTHRPADDDLPIRVRAERRRSLASCHDC